MIAMGTVGLVAVACRQIVGIHDDGSPLVDASDGDLGGALAYGLALAPGSCRACIESRCCSEAQRCGSSKEPACSALATCELACNGDARCRSQCTVDHAIGPVSSLPALEACAATSCENECNLQCGGSLAYIPPNAADKCQQCATVNSCSEFQACSNDAACLALYRCRYACVTPDCATACDSANDAGIAAFNALASAGLSHCVQDCQLGDDFACIGHVTWPFAKASAIDITLHVRNYSPPYAPVSGANVKLCAASDTGCVTPLDANGVTDANGDAHLRLAKVVDLAPQVFFDVDSPTFTPHRFYPGFPFSAPNARLIQEVAILDKALYASVWTQAGFPAPIAGRGHIVIEAALFSQRSA